jgi:hypothetical protein
VTSKIGWLKANPALDWLSLLHFFLISSSKPGSERVPVPDSDLIIAKLDLDDETRDHGPGRLDILPAERGIYTKRPHGIIDPYGLSVPVPPSNCV